MLASGSLFGMGSASEAAVATDMSGDAGDTGGLSHKAGITEAAVGAAVAVAVVDGADDTSIAAGTVAWHSGSGFRGGGGGICWLPGVILTGAASVVVVAVTALVSFSSSKEENRARIPLTAVLWLIPLLSPFNRLLACLATNEHTRQKC